MESMHDLCGFRVGFSPVYPPACGQFRDGLLIRCLQPSKKFHRGYNPDMPLVPELQMRCDENSIPVSAKCSLCGEQMAQGTPRITNPIENVAWFSSQFGLHVAQNHPEIAARKSAGSGGQTHLPRPPRESKTDNL